VIEPGIGVGLHYAKKLMTMIVKGCAMPERPLGFTDCWHRSKR
jgi:hypothetical protein